MRTTSQAVLGAVSLLFAGADIAFAALPKLIYGSTLIEAGIAATAQRQHNGGTLGEYIGPYVERDENMLDGSNSVHAQATAAVPGYGAPEGRGLGTATASLGETNFSLYASAGGSINSLVGDQGAASGTGNGFAEIQFSTDMSAMYKVTAYVHVQSQGTAGEGGGPGARAEMSTVTDHFVRFHDLFLQFDEVPAGGIGQETMTHTQLFQFYAGAIYTA